MNFNNPSFLSGIRPLNGIHNHTTAEDAGGLIAETAKNMIDGLTDIIADFSSTVEELEAKVDLLERTVVEKDEQIETLEELEAKVDLLERTVVEKDEQIETLEKELIEALLNQQ